MFIGEISNSIYSFNGVYKPTNIHNWGPPSCGNFGGNSPSNTWGKWELPGLVNVYKKLWKDPPCLKGKSTISMAMFNSYLVGGFNPSEKYEFVRLDHHPSYWGK